MSGTLQLRVDTTTLVLLRTLFQQVLSLTSGKSLEGFELIPQMKKEALKLGSVGRHAEAAAILAKIHKLEDMQYENVTEATVIRALITHGIKHVSAATIVEMMEDPSVHMRRGNPRHREANPVTAPDAVFKRPVPKAIPLRIPPPPPPPPPPKK